MCGLMSRPEGGTSDLRLDAVTAFDRDLWFPQLSVEQSQKGEGPLGGSGLFLSSRPEFCELFLNFTLADLIQSPQPRLFPPSLAAAAAGGSYLTRSNTDGLERSSKPSCGSAVRQAPCCSLQFAWY